MGDITNFPFGSSSFGITQFGNAGFIPAGGTVYYVWPGNATPIGTHTGASDGNTGLSPDEALVTLSAAHSKMTANQNDVAILIGNSSASSANVVSETATLTWSKDLCHIIGTGYNKISQRCSIRAVTNDFTPLVSVTADGCVFANFHVFHGFATDSAQIAWAETGQRNAYFNCHIGGMGAQLAADNAGSRTLTLTGDGERYFSNCVFGLDTVDRDAANATVESLSAATRDIFEDCYFIARCDAGGPLHYSVGVGGIDRFIIFKNCLFLNFKGTEMTQVMSVAASAGGEVLLPGSNHAGAAEFSTGDLPLQNQPAAAATGGKLATVAGA